MQKIMRYVWVDIPKRSGNYTVRYNGKIERDDFTTNGNHWWNVGELKHPEEVEWNDESFRPL